MLRPDRHLRCQGPVVSLLHKLLDWGEGNPMSLPLVLAGGVCLESRLRFLVCGCVHVCVYTCVYVHVCVEEGLSVTL